MKNDAFDISCRQVQSITTRAWISLRARQLTACRPGSSATSLHPSNQQNLQANKLRSTSPIANIFIKHAEARATVAEPQRWQRKVTPPLYLPTIPLTTQLTNPPQSSQVPRHPRAPPFHGPNRLLLHLYTSQNRNTHEHAQIRPNWYETTTLPPFHHSAMIRETPKNNQ